VVPEGESTDILVAVDIENRKDSSGFEVDLEGHVVLLGYSLGMATNAILPRFEIYVSDSKALHHHGKSVVLLVLIVIPHLIPSMGQVFPDHLNQQVIELKLH
jgi:hypothetical protein